MSKNSVKIIAICAVFILIDVLIFSRIFKSNTEKQKLQEQYEQAISIYNESSDVFNKDGLLIARSTFAEIQGYKDAESYISKIDGEVGRITSYDLAVASYYDKDYNAAYTAFEPLGGYRDTKAYISDMSSEILAAAQTYSDDEKYDEALKILLYIPEYTGDYYSESVTLSRTISAAKEEREREKKYDAAVAEYENVNYKTAQSAFLSIKDYRDSTEYLEKIGEAYYAKAQDLYEQKSYGDAIKNLETITSATSWSGYSKAVQLKTDITDSCVENALSDADNKYYETHDIDEVVSILTAANSEVGNDSRITAAIDDYKNNTVVYIADLDMFNYSFKEGADLDGGEAINEYLTSNYGVTYKNSVTCSGGYIGYLVDGKGYTVFKGVIGCPEGMHSDSFRHGAYIDIIGYKDDKGTTLYTTDEITDASKPIDVELDISGYEVIYFQWHCVGMNIWKDWGEFATIFEGKCMK